MFFVYILVSTRYSKTYVGITDNLIRRLNEHNKGQHIYTKRYMPWKILFSNEFDTRVTARKKEKYLKSAAGRRWIKKVFFSTLPRW
ncbi:GIY-YIG nuclease family protein [Candidatus Gottesmanbacteria bacterium]|nr:GIY-YIG nuclease family protein [Candidatus Gottesmanbacteria bacterium]